MSSIANLSSASAAFPAINFHLHGHKHGSHVESTDSSGSDASTQAPAGATQNLFGTLLQSLEQVIGLKSNTAAAATTAAASTASTTPATTASATTSASASTPSTTASAATGTSTTAQQGTLLRNYLNNLSHNMQADGSQSLKVAGSSISTNA
jgi:hypothetical protein